MESETVSRKGFIRSAALLTVLPAGFAASCGGGTSSNGGTSSDGGGQTTPATTPEETTPPPEETTVAEPPPESANAIASVSDVPPGTATEFEDGGQPAVLVHLDSGEFVAYSAVCTHRGCTVAYNDSGELACPCHGSVFDPANGAEVTAGPAPEPLPEIPVTERDGSVVRA